MAQLRLNLLGELRVLRDGKEVSLPPSKKTRALLAYLALNDKKFRREHLCELLWEVPDDPRGSLRWSLSKLRRLVDDKEARIIADRNHVSLDATDIEIDTRCLQDLVSNGLADAATEELEAMAAACSGQFLEGLELANFHEFSAWCIAEREQINRAQIALLNELVARLEDREPERAIEYARKLVGLDPYNKAFRARLIRLMVSCDREREAEQQFQQGSRLLKELGEDSTELFQAWRGAAPAAAQSRQPADAKPERAVEDFDLESAHGLVGRTMEVAAIRASHAASVNGNRAGCLLLKGEPGIGKSRLMQCAQELARKTGAGLLRAGAFESEIVRPFGLWNDALRESTDADVAGLLSGSEQIDRNRLLSSLSSFVSGMAEKGPVIILFDDFQWSDESSAAALHYVLRMNRKLPVWVVLGARTEELQSNFPVLKALRGLRQEKLLETLDLQPLSDEDVKLLIAREAPEIDVELIGEKCRGNPLLAIELARAVAAGDVLGTLNELIGERLARMSEASTITLQWAAVLAPRISIGSLIRYSELADNVLDLALDEAEKNGFLFPTESGYQFSHDLVTRSIYRGIPPARRKTMHRRIAELLEADTAMDLKLAAELARHASQSGDPLLAARALVQAARLCLRFYANDDAYDLAARGLTFVGQLAEADRISLTLELREAQLTAAPLDDWEAAALEFQNLAEKALDLGDLPSARLGYHLASDIRWAHGHFSGARKSILQAERVTRGGSEEVQVLGMAEAARCLLLLEKDLPEADAMLMEAGSRAARQGLDSNALTAATGMMRYYENRLDEAEELLEEARTRSKAAGDHLNEFQANEYLCMIEIERDDFAAARQRCQALLEIGAKLRQGSEEPFARALDAICAYASGDQAAAVDECLQDLRRIDAKQRLTYALNRAALVDLQYRRWESALARGQEALKNANIMDRASERIMALVILAEASAALHDSAASRDYRQTLLATPPTAGAQWAHRRAAGLLARQEGKDDG